MKQKTPQIQSSLQIELFYQDSGVNISKYAIAISFSSRQFAISKHSQESQKRLRAHASSGRVFLSIKKNSKIMLQYSWKIAITADGTKTNRIQLCF